MWQSERGFLKTKVIMVVSSLKNRVFGGKLWVLNGVEHLLGSEHLSVRRRIESFELVSRFLFERDGRHA